MSKYDWIYNRIKLSARFNPYLIIDLSKQKPDRFPLYVRHIDTRVSYLEVASRFEDLPTEDGYVGQKIVEGEKIYFDFTIKEFTIVERNALLEHDGYLTKVDHSSPTIDMAAESFDLKNGKITIETIGGVIFRIRINEF